MTLRGETSTKTLAAWRKAMSQTRIGGGVKSTDTFYFSHLSLASFSTLCQSLNLISYRRNPFASSYAIATALGCGQYRHSAIFQRAER